jgi:hypothetical protein
MTNISQRRTFKDMGALVNEIFPPIRGTVSCFIISIFVANMMNENNTFMQ